MRTRHATGRNGAASKADAGMSEANVRRWRSGRMLEMLRTTEKESEGAMAALGKRENFVNETPSLAANVPERYDIENLRRPNYFSLQREPHTQEIHHVLRDLSRCT